MDKFQGGFKNNEYTIDITNDERRYFAIDELKEEYDSEVYYSRTNGIYKRTTIFYSEDTIKKVIYEEKYISNNNELVSESYKEYDTNLKTIDRKLLVPLTSRGKEKKITPTNVMNIDPFGCIFYVKFDYLEKRCGMCAYNTRNNQELPIENIEEINDIKNKEDFREFVKWYIKTCPEDYFEKIEQMKNLELFR